jgi:hypothetical protein
MVRTAAFLAAPIWRCVAGAQKGYGWHFGRLFLVHFLGEQKMNKNQIIKNSDEEYLAEGK